jgi:hypothetical protein
VNVVKHSGGAVGTKQVRLAFSSKTILQAAFASSGFTQTFDKRDFSTNLLHQIRLGNIFQNDLNYYRIESLRSRTLQERHLSQKSENSFSKSLKQTSFELDTFLAKSLERVEVWNK